MWRTLLPSGLLLLAYLADRGGLLPVCWRQPLGAYPLPITRVVDGDTLVDACGRRLRLIGVDTPERGRPLAASASAFTRAWLTRHPNPLVRFCQAQPRDRYGRLLVRMGTPAYDLSRALLARGLAWPLHLPPCGLAEQAEDLRTARAAELAARGLWHRGPRQVTYPWRRLPPDAYVRLRAPLRYRLADDHAWRLVLGRRPSVEVRLPYETWHRLPAELARWLAAPTPGVWLEVEGRLRRRGRRWRLTQTRSDRLRRIPGSGR